MFFQCYFFMQDFIMCIVYFSSIFTVFFKLLVILVAYFYVFNYFKCLNMSLINFLLSLWLVIIFLLFIRHIFIFWRGYASTFYASFMLFPASLTEDQVYAFFLFAYIFGIYSSYHIPVPQIYVCFYIVNLPLTFYHFLKSEESVTSPLYLDLCYSEPWFFSFDATHSTDRVFLRYNEFRLCQWNILNNLDILVVRICLYFSIFLFFLI